MQAQVISGATRELYQPKSWNEQRNGPCRSLFIKDVEYAPAGVPIMLSEWRPTCEELADLNRGHAVVLGICGTTHPPVFITVHPIKSPDIVTTMCRQHAAE